MPREYIVPGARDLIPPQGRVTVQLLHPETGKIRKELKAENAVTDWWLSQVNMDGITPVSLSSDASMYRGPSFSPMASAMGTGFTYNTALRALITTGAWKGTVSNGHLPRLWASSANITPDATKPWIPTNNTTDGAITGFAHLDVSVALDSERLQRGTVVLAESWANINQTRMVIEWGTTQGNGVYRSIGVGVTNHPRSGNQAAPGVFPYLQNIPLRSSAPMPLVGGYESTGGSGLRPAGHNSALADMQWPFVSGHADTAANARVARSGQFDPVDDVLWYAHYTSVNSVSLLKYDFNTGLRTVGPNDASVTGTGNVGVSAVGSDLWLVRGPNVMRCVKFTDTNLTISNTYDKTSELGGETFFDVTTDGTSLYALTASRVFVINPGTGATSASFNHGKTCSSNSSSIEYDPNMDHLWLSHGTGYQALAPNSNTSSVWNDHISSNSSLAFEASNDRLVSISKTDGTALPYICKVASNLRSNSTLASVSIGKMTAMTPDGFGAFYTAANGGVPLDTGFFGPNMASHALLGDDVTKTSSDALKIVYDFDFS